MNYSKAIKQLAYKAYRPLLLERQSRGDQIPRDLIETFNLPSNRHTKVSDLLVKNPDKQTEVTSDGQSGELEGK